MLGLSYPGGLSRDTTAMLCMIDEEPVMVFVDRLAADDTELVTSRGDAAAANVFRHTLDNLVIYEVSPWQSAKAAKFLTLAAPQAGSR